MRAIITVLGKDNLGIISKVSHECEKLNVRIIDVSQSLLKDLFAMIMVVDISHSTVVLSELTDTLTSIGHSMGLKIYVMHEDVFNAMHQI